VLLARVEPTTPNMPHHIATCWPNAHNMLRPQCCDMLRWHVAIVWPGLYMAFVASQRRFCEIFLRKMAHTSVK